MVDRVRGELVTPGAHNMETGDLERAKEEEIRVKKDTVVGKADQHLHKPENNTRPAPVLRMGEISRLLMV